MTLGLAVRDGEQLVPRGRIIPTEGVYLAFDTFSVGLADPPGVGGELHADVVLAGVA